MKSNDNKAVLIDAGMSAIKEIIIAKMCESDMRTKTIVQLQMIDGIVGYALEVTRPIKDEEYSYVGFVSLAKIKTDPDWLSFQKHACEEAFKATIKDVLS